MKKIIFFSYHSLTVLKEYYDALSKNNDCWWIIYNEKVYDEIINLGYKKIIFKGAKSKYHNDKNYFFQKVFKKILNKLINLISVNNLNFSNDINQLKPDIIISNTLFTLENYKPNNKDIMSVYVFHSLCFKKYNIIKKNLLFDLVILPSKFHYTEMKKKFLGTITYNGLEKEEGILSDKRINDFSTHKYSHGKRGTKFNIIGWPRSDFFVKNKIKFDEKQKLLSYFKLNKKFKTILYAPTWNAYYKLGLFPKSFGKYIDAFEEISHYLSCQQFYVFFCHLYILTSLDVV